MKEPKVDVARWARDMGLEPGFALWIEEQSVIHRYTDEQVMSVVLALVSFRERWRWIEDAVP